MTITNKKKLMQNGCDVLDRSEEFFPRFGHRTLIDFPDAGIDLQVSDGPHQPASMFLFGAFCVNGPEGEDLTPANQKSKALLALVATSPRGTRSRAWLCGKLWSDRAPAQALGSLRQSLSEIRRSFGRYSHRLLVIDKFSVSLDLDALQVDALMLRPAPETGANERGRFLGINEEFLEGIDIRDPEFEEWLTGARRYWDELRSPVA